MRNGFTYKNKHSSEFGIVAKTKSKPVFPEMKSYTFEPALDDGAYDFSNSNEYGRAFYNDRFFEIQLQISADSLRSLENKVSKIACWLKGSGELIFDTAPCVKWRARVVSELGFAPSFAGRMTVMTVVFRVEPFAFCFYNTADGPELDSIFSIDSNIPIDVPTLFTWRLIGGNNQYASVSHTIRIVNAGNVQVRPVIRIEGNVKNISLGFCGKSLEINTSGTGFIVDFKKCLVTDLSGKSVMNRVGGDFFELSSDCINDVAVSMSANGEAKLSVEYVPRFVYDYDFDDVDWGNSNA